MDFSGAAGAGAAILGGAGIITDWLDRKKAKKALKAREARALNYIDTAASNSKADLARQTTNAQGASTQDMIGRGFYNSTVATDAGNAIAADSASARNAIDQRVGQQKADVTMNFAESAGGGGGYEALAAGLGQYIASRNMGADSGSSAAAKAAPPVENSSGNYALNSGAYASPYSMLAGGGDNNAMLSAANQPQSMFSYYSSVPRMAKYRKSSVPQAGGSMY